MDENELNEAWEFNHIGNTMRVRRAHRDAHTRELVAQLFELWRNAV